MTLVWASGYNGIPDPDAQVYIAAVEAADGQTLEEPVQFAIHEFVAGCKYDGIWNAIKSSCILAGARTLAGALVPLKGTAPTNNNFVSGDYNRETGLVGNGSTKYLNSNRAGDADPQNSRHVALYATTTPLSSGVLINSGNAGIGATSIETFNGILYFRSTTGAVSAGGIPTANGLYAINRSSSVSFTAMRPGTSTTVSANSNTPVSNNYTIYCFNNSTGFQGARLSFYSIGESLDLALLDNRVSTLMTDIGAAIP